MKKIHANLILVGIIILLAAVLIGVLIFLKNQPAQERAVIQPISTIQPLEADSSLWGVNYPNEYSSLLLTANNHTATTYGGSAQKSYLLEDPRLVLLFMGSVYSVDFNQPRGHENTLIDVRATKRVTASTHATCYSCKSSDNPGLWAQLGMEAFDAKLFSDMTPNISNPIGCANCHEAGTMRLVITNPAVDAAFKSEGLDWRTFTRQQMRSAVCANCHVTYYFAGDNKVLTVPWDNGTRVEDIIQSEDAANFSEWTYPGTGTGIIKARHPDYELYTADSTHYQAGVACADCHMPYLRDGAMKYSSHDIMSPLLDPQQACGQCHTDVDVVLARVSVIQDTVHAAKISTEDALIDAITAIKGAVANPTSDLALLDQARTLHRHAQYMWDFISSANSMGFHNPDEALRILRNATDLARQAQMKAAQAAGDPSLLTAGVYYSLNPVPTPVP
ncbi:MAG: ammonia-forming cytochrome c nitrite reductase subunit c552 [Anaerolineales bacterium]|jgi:nitrite reductase (cytochrome c-552)